MKTVTPALERKNIRKAMIIDTTALICIGCSSALAHVFDWPLYMLEPMRLMLIIALAHSSKANAYVLAFTLPIFSYLISGHPFLGKMLIITAELLINVFLFYSFVKLFRNTFSAMLFSIILSKLFCYLMYFWFFSFTFVMIESTPVFLIMQLLTSLIFSGYIGLVFRKQMTYK